MTRSGFTLPAPHAPLPSPLSENERTWIEFLRLLSLDGDPPVTLRAVQALRHVLSDAAETASRSP